MKQLVANGERSRPKRTKAVEADPRQLEFPFDDATLWHMAKKPKTKRLPKLSDVERHKRFVEMAREVGASEDQKIFDKAFEKVVILKKPSRR